jgi:hypothetical protein
MCVAQLCNKNACLGDEANIDGKDRSKVVIGVGNDDEVVIPQV